MHYEQWGFETYMTVESSVILGYGAIGTEIYSMQIGVGGDIFDYQPWNQAFWFTNPFYYIENQQQVQMHAWTGGQYSLSFGNLYSFYGEEFVTYGSDIWDGVYYGVWYGGSSSYATVTSTDLSNSYNWFSFDTTTFV